MYILGIAGYIILCLLAIVWLIGVRTQLGAGLGVILGSLFFTAATIAVPSVGASFLHAWWIIPCGFGVGMASPFAFDLPLVGFVLRIVGSIYAAIVRTGIDERTIQAAHGQATWQAVDEYALKDADKDD